MSHSAITNTSVISQIIAISCKQICVICFIMPTDILKLQKMWFSWVNQGNNTQRLIGASTYGPHSTSNFFYAFGHVATCSHSL